MRPLHPGIGHSTPHLHKLKPAGVETGGFSEFVPERIAILGSRQQQHTEIKLTFCYRFSLLACAVSRCRLRFLTDRRRRGKFCRGRVPHWKMDGAQTMFRGWKNSSL